MNNRVLAQKSFFVVLSSKRVAFSPLRLKRIIYSNQTVIQKWPFSSHETSIFTSVFWKEQLRLKKWHLKCLQSIASYHESISSTATEPQWPITRIAFKELTSLDPAFKHLEALCWLMWVVLTAQTILTHFPEQNTQTWHCAAAFHFPFHTCIAAST